MPIQVEFLLIVKEADAFCENVKAFNQLLDVDSRLEIGKDKIKFKGQTEFDYNALVGEIPNRTQRFFLLTFSLDESPNNDNVETFSEMLRVVRQVIRKVSDQIETLSDDISGYYSKLSYLEIHRVENLMRKLIANFMLVNVGADWVDESTPQEVKDSIATSKRKNRTSNVLHTIDFIDLSDYLLRAYSEKPVRQIFEKLADVSALEELKEIKEQFEPRSNWTRYFSEIVDCEEAYLNKRWNQLYELRCKVAHNAIVTKQDFEQITKLSNELSEKLIVAIEKLREVKVPEEEVEQVVTEAGETAAKTFRQLFSENAEILESRILIPLRKTDYQGAMDVEAVLNMHDFETVMTNDANGRPSTLHIVNADETDVNRILEALSEVGQRELMRDAMIRRPGDSFLRRVYFG